MSNTVKSTRRKTDSSAHSAKRVSTPRKSKSSKSASGPSPSPTRENSKLANMIALLSRKDGATLEQMMKATDWQAHSVRGVMSGALKKKRGLNISSVKDGSTRIYRLVDAG